MSDEISPKSRVGADLKTTLVMVGTLLAAAFMAGQTYYALTQKISQLDLRMSEVVTRTDLIRAQDDMGKKLAARLGGVVVECPKHVTKGEAVARCKIIMPTDP